MKQMLMEFERKKLLIQDDAEGLLQLANKMQNFLENKEENLEKLIDKLKKYPEIESEIVRFNVVGTQFAAYKSTLTKKIRKPSGENASAAANVDNKLQYYEPHLLECMMNGLVKVVKDPQTDAIFINRNPDYFKYILEYLRAIECEEDDQENENQFTLPESVDADFKSRLIKEAAYFNLLGLKDVLTGNNPASADASLPSAESSILKMNKLQAIFNKLVKDKEELQNKKWTLLYRATVDGFSAADFHRKCDNKGATLTIIKSRDTPNVFGGFAVVNWDSTTQNYKLDPYGFIFSLVNNENKPLIFNCSSDTSEIYCRSASGPTFGAGHGIYVCSNANTQSGSYSNLSNYYADGFEYDSTRARSFLAGSNEFFVSEIEVFEIIS